MFPDYDYRLNEVISFNGIPVYVLRPDKTDAIRYLMLQDKYYSQQSEIERQRYKKYTEQLGYGDIYIYKLSGFDIARELGLIRRVHEAK